MVSRHEQPRCHVKLHSKEVSNQTKPGNDLYSQIESCFFMLPESECLPAVTKLLQIVVARSLTSIPVTIPDDFLSLTLRAMSHLKQSGRSNVVYSLVKGLGQMRADGSDSKLPTRRMPMGLLEYVISFHSSETLNQVSNLCNVVMHDSHYCFIIVAFVRLCLVPRITNYGVILCSLFLGLNGANFTLVLYGVSQEWCRMEQQTQ